MIVPIKIPNKNTPCTDVDDAVYNHLSICMNNTPITIVEPIACKPGAILPMFDIIIWNKIEPTPIIGSDTKHTPVMILKMKMIINVKPKHHKYEMLLGTGYAYTWFLIIAIELNQFHNNLKIQHKKLNTKKLKIAALIYAYTPPAYAHGAVNMK